MKTERGNMTLEGAALVAANEAKDAERQNGKVRHLRSVDVDTETGEFVCRDCKDKDLVIEGHEETIRSQGAKIRQLRRDKAAEARSSQYWPLALEAWGYWQRECGHPRSEFTVARFFLVEPFLKSEGLVMVKCAIAGAAHDPYTADRPNRNGHVEVYDGWETIFKNRDAFERHCRKAPREIMREAKQGHEVDPEALRGKAEVILALMPADDRPIADRAAEAVEKAKREMG